MPSLAASAAREKEGHEAVLIQDGDRRAEGLIGRPTAHEATEFQWFGLALFWLTLTSSIDVTASRCFKSLVGGPYQRL